MTEGPINPGRPSAEDRRSLASAQAGRVLPPAWGLWASLAGTILGLMLLLTTRLAVVVGFVLARQWVGPGMDLAGGGWGGILHAAGSLLAMPLVLFLVTLLVVTRGRGNVDYLDWRPPTARAAVLAVLTLGAGLGVVLSLAVVLDRPIVTANPADSLRGIPVWLVALAAAVAVPVIEEVLFRGFLFRGLADSDLGPGMAIGLTAIAWTAFQSFQVVPITLYSLALLYLFGLFLGLVRFLSGSLPLVIFLHGLASTVAVAEAVYFSG